MDGKNNGNVSDRDSRGRFQPGNNATSGRPKGSKNKSTLLRNELLGPLLPEAVKKLHKAVKAGERWAVEMTISYSLPKPKPVDPDELEAFEERVAQLEAAVEKSK